MVSYKMFKLVQHNILAPMWVNNRYKQLPCYSLYTDVNRITVTLDHLLKYDADVYVLSEVEESLCDTIAEYMQNYHCYFTSNEEGYWHEWLDGGKEWKPNGSCICLSNRSFNATMHTGIKLGHGCTCSSVRTVFNGTFNLTITGVHFDTEEDRSYDQLKTLLNYFNGIENHIISGDLNLTDISMLTNRGYYDTAERITPTTPITGMIDHTLVKGDMSGISKVHNSRLEHPCDLVKHAGSDHYVTEAIIRVY